MQERKNNQAYGGECVVALLYENRYGIFLIGEWFEWARWWMEDAWKDDSASVG